MSDFPHLPNCKCKKYTETLSKKDEWYIDAPRHHNCFWNYIKHNERPHSLREVGEKLGLSIAVIINTEKKALAKFKKQLKKLGLDFNDLVDKSK